VTVGTVAFLPAAPVLVAGLGGSTAHDGELRAACLAAAHSIVEPAPAAIVVTAAVPSESRPAGSTWDFGGFGVHRDLPSGAVALPWPLGIGAWWLEAAGWTGECVYGGADAPPPARDRSVNVLVVGDGSSLRSERSSDHVDERADRFDAEVARCLATGDVRGLLTLDGEVGDAVGCSGWPAWHWLGRTLAGTTVRDARLLADQAPYGVRYLVAVWHVDG